MSQLLDTLVRLLGNPYNTILASVLGGLALCFSLLWFYYPNHIDPSLASSEFSASLSSPAFLNACLVTMSIGGLLLLDLIMDVSAFFIEYRSIKMYRKKLINDSITKPATEKEKTSDQLKEFLVRFLYIICVLVPSITVWTGKPNYRCILGYFGIRFRNIVMIGLCMFTVVDTFHHCGAFLKWLCIACR